MLMLWHTDKIFQDGKKEKEEVSIKTTILR